MGMPSADLGCVRHPNKVDKTTGYVRLGRDGKRWWAHRYYWTLRHGEIPPGHQIDHLCRNKWCMNLRHMEVVTQQENLKRAIPYRTKQYKPYNTWNLTRERNDNGKWRSARSV